ncbi:MAG: hypothetical protein Q9221_007858 [Calogaya cf. arnoldii]
MQREFHRNRYLQYPPGPRHRRHRRDHHAHGHSTGSSKSTRSNLSWLDGELKQGPTDKDIRILQSKIASPATRSSTLSLEEAFALAEQALQGHVRAQMYCMEPQLTTADKRSLPFKVFNEVDREFFRSMLKGNVSLGWCNMREGVFSQTRRADLDGNPRIRIELSSRLQYATRVDIFSALMHHMIHAYYLQCCGYHDKEDSGAGYDLRHGLAFLALRQCIAEHYDHIHSVDVDDWRITAVAKTLSLQEVQKPSGTGQQANDKLFPKTVFFLTKEGGEESPRSIEKLEHPREGYFFIRFEDRHYPVLRSSVADLAALTSSPQFKDKAFLQIPAKTTQEEFLTFALFLIHKSCPPSWKGLLGEVAKPRTGPPVIKPYNASAPKPLLHLVTAFRLEEQLKYKPFQDHVMTELRKLQATAEDPMAVLEKIYNSASVSSSSSISYKLADPLLREWVRAWLAVDLISPGMGQYEMTYQSNLGVLRDSPMWSHRLVQLRGTSSTFEEDEKLANDALCRRVGVKSIRDIFVPFSLQHNLKAADGPGFSPQQPFGVPSWHFPPGNPVGPQQSDNMAQRVRDTFDLSGLREGLPMSQLHGLQNLVHEPSRRPCRPEELQTLAALIRQQQVLRDGPNGPNGQGSNTPWSNLPLYLPADLQQWMMGDRRPGL